MLVDMKTLVCFLPDACGVNLDKSLLLWGHLACTVVKARLTSQGPFRSGMEDEPTTLKPGFLKKNAQLSLVVRALRLAYRLQNLKEGKKNSPSISELVLYTHTHS